MTQSYQIPNPGQNFHEFTNRSAEAPFEVIAEPCSAQPKEFEKYTVKDFAGNPFEMVVFQPSGVFDTNYINQLLQKSVDNFLWVYPFEDFSQWKFIKGGD